MHLSWEDVDLNELTVGSVKTYDQGGRFVTLFYKDKPFVFQTPLLKLEYSLSKWTNDNNGITKYTLTYSSSDEGYNKFLKQLQEKLVDFGIANSLGWFKNKINSHEVIESYLTFSDRLTVPFNNKTQSFECELYNKDKEKIDVEKNLLKNASIVAIVHANTIWLTSYKFGLVMKALQLKIEDKGSTQAYLFLDDSNEFSL